MYSSENCSRSTAADEVDDFEGVVGLDVRIAPESARKNIEIAFDGNAGSAEAEVGEKGVHGKPVGDFAYFPVDANVHCGVLSGVAEAAGGFLARVRMAKRISS